MKPARRSALVDLVMKDASEEEKAEATRHWYDFLQALLSIIDEDERRRRADSRESGEGGRFGL